MANIQPKKFTNHKPKILCSEVHQGHLVLKVGVDFVHLGQIIIYLGRIFILA